MSLNNWKLLNQFRDTIVRLANDESFQTLLKKNSQQIFHRFSSVGEIFKSLELKSTTLPSVIVKKDHTKSEHKWKNSLAVSRSTVSSQTEHVIFALRSAENDEALLERLEALISHIIKYPESRNSAIRVGAIGTLLRLRKAKKNSEDMQSALREALVLLGYADPVVKDGIRILSMDGGGIRGLLILEMLKKLEDLTGRRVYELFDLFCGVSTGAILGFALGIHRRSLDEVARGYKDISLEVFKQSALWGTSGLVWSQAYYNTMLWEKKLRDHLGSNTLYSTSRDPQCPKLCAISAVVNQSHLAAYVFRNYALPWKVKSHYLGDGNVEVWQAARASAAAPTYFEEFRLGSYLHQDGGIVANNPTAIALHEAKLIWPNTPIQCIVSFGTGRVVPTASDLLPMPTAVSTSWANKFYKILDSATDTEGVHIMLNDLLPDSTYYRFNPYLTEMISMVEINELKLDQMERDAVMYLRRNEDKFQNAAKVLMKDKSVKQHVTDYVKQKVEMYSF